MTKKMKLILFSFRINFLCYFMVRLRKFVKYWNKALKFLIYAQQIGNFILFLLLNSLIILHIIL